MKLVSVAQMIAVEKEANASGLSYAEMMENAGKGLANVISHLADRISEKSILALVGSGNNGGDALVALRELAKEGWTVSAYLVRPRPQQDPLLDLFSSSGGKINSAEEDNGFFLLQTLCQNHAVLLDGILGTGARLPLKPEIAEMLAFVVKLLASMETRPLVVAVDCPSGIDCDSGAAAAECIPADITVTMAAYKQGLLALPAFQLVGEIQLVDIGLGEYGENLQTWRSIQRIVMDKKQTQQWLPSRPLDAHKGTFGTAVIAAGSINYTGAALLSAEAAYRSGAGLVTLASPALLHTTLAGHIPEVTWIILPDEVGVIASDAADVLLKNLERANSLLIGPGFGMENSTGEFVARLLESGSGSRGKMGFARPISSTERATIKLPPFIVDADGLKLLARIPNWPKRLPPFTILTPHPGEMSVLTGLPKDEIQSHRLETAEHFSREWGHVVVLKGAFTLIAAPDGRTAIIPIASPALARAGTGDVLAGLIAGLLAQGLDGFQAASAGAWIHAQAGLSARRSLGNSAAVLARDILQGIPQVLKELN